MNSVDITIESIDLNTKVHAHIECETLDDVINVITRINGFGGYLKAGPLPESAPTSWASFCAPEPTPNAAPLSRKGHSWTPAYRAEAQGLLDLGMNYEDVAARTGRTADGIAMAVHAGYLALPLDHPRRTKRSKAPALPELRRKPRLARHEDVRPMVEMLRASGAL